jgi:flagellar basal-body rod protein FlgC
MSLGNTFWVGATGTLAQSLRLNTIASNIANAEAHVDANGTPYRARHVVFELQPIAPGSPASGVQVGQIVESAAPFKKAYRPGHPHADDTGYVTLPNVDVIEEMVNMVAASRSFQMNVEVMSNSRQLMMRLLDSARG